MHMRSLKTISLPDDVQPMIQRMVDRGVNFSAWVAEKIREEYNADTPFIVTTMEKLMNNNPMMEDWQVSEKSKTNLTSLLKTMSKEELEATISEPTMDETTKSFAKIFLKRLSS